jgi:hypothetical protein
MANHANHHPSYPPVLDRLLRGQRIRIVLGIGLISGIAFAVDPQQNAFWLLVSLVFLGAIVGMLTNRWLVTRRDRLAAAALAGELRKGVPPVPIPPGQVDAYGEQFHEDEDCFVSRVPAERSIFYGKPTVVTRGAVIAWGSPLALAMSACFTFGLWQHGKKKAQKAAPQWREATRVYLWITSKRVMIKDRRGGKSLHFPLHMIQSCSVDEDGLVFVNSQLPGVPFKVRTRGAAWSSVLVHYLSGDGIVEVKVPVSLLSTESRVGAAFPG